MARNGIPVGAPIEYPTVTIKGTTYTLKMSLGAEYMLDQMGVNLAQDWPRVFSNPTGPGKVTMFIKVFSAMVAHTFVDTGTVPPTAEQWAHQISIEEFRAICEAVKETFLKAKPPANIPLRESEANATKQ